MNADSTGQGYQPGQPIAQPQPAQPQPGQPQPGQPQPGQPQPGQMQPGQMQPGQMQPGQMQPGQMQPQGYQPGMQQMQPAAPPPAASKPINLAKIFLVVCLAFVGFMVLFGLIGWNKMLDVSLKDADFKQLEKFIAGIGYFGIAGLFGLASLIFAKLVRSYKS